MTRRKVRWDLVRGYAWCLVVGHEWVSWLDGNRREDRVWGFTKRVCTRCKMTEYAPGAYAGDPPS